MLGNYANEEGSTDHGKLIKEKKLYYGTALFIFFLHSLRNWICSKGNRTKQLRRPTAINELAELATFDIYEISHIAELTKLERSDIRHDLTYFLRCWMARASRVASSLD